MPTRTLFAAEPACRSPLLSGALLIVTGELMFACMGASIRVAAQSLPDEMVVFASLYAGRCGRRLPNGRPSPEGC